ALAIEQARGCNEANARTHAGDGSAALMPAPQPGHNFRVALEDIVKADASGGNEDEVAFADVAQGGFRMKLQRAMALDGAAIYRSGGHAEARIGARAGKQVPQRSGVKKDFYWTDGSGREGVFRE